MTQAEVLAFVALHGCINADPVITSDELGMIVDMYARGNGVWDRAGAVAEVWTLKAGRAAERYQFADDAQTFYRQQVMENCEKQATRWRKRRTGSISTLPIDETEVTP